MNMGGLFTLERKQVLCATETEAFFAEVQPGKGRDRVEVLSHLDKKSDAGLDAATLVAGTGRQKAKVALVLPLKEFQLLSVTAPPVAREAIAKMLPYSLAKLLSTPVTDSIYDWQVAQKFKDRHELTVYLFPAVRFHLYRTQLEVRKKEIAWFEPDVFAACSYLYFKHSGAAATPFLCLLVWQRSLSIAVYENQRITLVRSVEMTMPEGQPQAAAAARKPANDGQKSRTDITLADQLEPKQPRVESESVEEFWLESSEDAAAVDDKLVADAVPSPLFHEDDQSMDFLAGFGLQADSLDDLPQTLASGLREDDPAGAEIVPPVDPWSLYLENVNLEILRTGDYHVSVLKGSPIREVFVGGAEHFFEALSGIVQTGQNLQTTRFPPQEIEAKCPQVVAAICIGALQR